MFALLIILGSCSEDPLLDEVKELDAEINTTSENAVIKGHYIVVVSKDPAVKNPKAAAILDKIMNKISEKAAAKINRKYTNVLQGFAAELTAGQVSELRKDRRILLVEEDRQVKLHSSIVQEFPSWGLDRIDQREGGCNRAYAYNLTGKGVTAYVMDTGMRVTHEDFGGRAVHGYDFVKEEGEEGRDCYGHGTPVAGIIGGTKYGVAKSIEIVSVKVFDCKGGSPASRILEAMDWVYINAARPAILNASFGYYASEAMDLAFENSLGAGIHFAVSAGNADRDACEYSPARVPGVLTVGASDVQDRIASYSSTSGSNYGSCVDVFAPGLNTRTASKIDDVSSRYFSGTSAAAPHVAGVMALYLELDPNITPEALHNAVLSNSTPNTVTGVPSGTNAFLYSLTEPIEFTPPNPPDLNLSVYSFRTQGSNYVNLKWDPTDIPYIHVYVDGTTTKVPVEGEYVTQFYNNDGNDQVRLEDSKRNATHRIKICEVGYANCSQEIIVVFGDGGGGGETTNEPPAADFTYTTNLLSLQFTDTSTDSDGSVTAWSWDFGDGQSSSTQHPSHNYTVAGTYTVSLMVTDDAGDTGSTSKNITVSAEEPAPGDISLTGSGTKVKGRWSADLSWNPAGTSVDIYRNNVKIASGENNGTYTDATDFKGSGSLTYKVCEAGSIICSNEVRLQY
ncbi:S8 family serine peptidase [Salinimicrobium sp. CAU 1759]